MDLTSLDLKDVCNLRSFSGTVPLFPLSTVVFFPNTLLPLHVFEPRYKQMVKDVSASERIIGMALLKPGWESNYYDNPEVYDVVGMGRIVSSETFEDGRINIVLYGLKRVKILEIMKDRPYRVARVEIVENARCESEEIYRSRIEDLITKWNFGLDEFRQELERFLPTDVAGLGRNDFGYAFLHDVQLGSTGHLLQGDGRLHFSRQIRIVESVRVTDTLVWH